jgi:hypothetical protein
MCSAHLYSQMLSSCEVSALTEQLMHIRDHWHGLLYWERGYRNPTGAGRWRGSLNLTENHPQNSILWKKIMQWLTGFVIVIAWECGKK